MAAVTIGAAVGAGFITLAALRKALGVGERIVEGKHRRGMESKQLEIQERLSVGEQRAQERALVLKRQLLIKNMAELRRKESEDRAETARRDMMRVGADQQNIQMALMAQLIQGMGSPLSPTQGMPPLSLAR